MGGGQQVGVDNTCRWTQKGGGGREAQKYTRRCGDDISRETNLEYKRQTFDVMVWVSYKGGGGSLGSIISGRAAGALAHVHVGVAATS